MIALSRLYRFQWPSNKLNPYSFTAKCQTATTNPILPPITVVPLLFPSNKPRITLPIPQNRHDPTHPTSQWRQARLLCQTLLPKPKRPYFHFPQSDRHLWTINKRKKRTFTKRKSKNKKPPKNCLFLKDLHFIWSFSSIYESKERWRSFRFVFKLEKNYFWYWLGFTLSRRVFDTCHCSSLETNSFIW